MSDIFSPEKRSEIMSRIKSKNTKPELLVRSIIHRMGYRFRIHYKKLPGAPDIVLPRHKKVIFVHGCFWHGHEGCSISHRPKTNTGYWNKKIDANIKRDKHYQDELQKLGWKVLVIWECETKKADILHQKLIHFLTDNC